MQLCRAINASINREQHILRLRSVYRSLIVTRARLSRMSSSARFQLVKYHIELRDDEYPDTSSQQFKEPYRIVTTGFITDIAVCLVQSRLDIY